VEVDLQPPQLPRLRVLLPKSHLTGCYLLAALQCQQVLRWRWTCALI
jgi:hypothetical protein